jgi:LysR family glycine cleavage system transcriptional activator
MIASEILNSEFLDLPPLNAMRAFEAVARLGGVAAAADELGVTSGAVSQQIKLLETVLGAKLVKRSGRGIGLTAEGRAVATLIAEPFRGLREAGQRLGRCDQPDGINLGASGAFGARWLARRLDRFETSPGGVPIRLICDPDPGAMDRFQIDLEIRFNLGEAPEANAMRLLSDSYAALASPSLIAAGPDEDWRGLLSRARLIQCEEADLHGADWTGWLDRRGIGRGDIHAGDRVALFEHAVEAAASGRGVALAPRSLADAAVDSGRLAILHDAGVEPARGGYDLIWPQGRGLRGPGRALKTFLIEESRPFAAVGAQASPI